MLGAAGPTRYTATAPHPPTSAQSMPAPRSRARRARASVPFCGPHTHAWPVGRQELACSGCYCTTSTVPGAACLQPAASKWHSGGRHRTTTAAPCCHGTTLLFTRSGSYHHSTAAPHTASLWLAQGVAAAALTCKWRCGGSAAAEVRYATIEKECLAIHWAINYFRNYLLGWKFTAVMDHTPLEWLTKSHIENALITSWALALHLF